jgi:hypothetical protein
MKFSEMSPVLGKPREAARGSESNCPVRNARKVRWLRELLEQWCKTRKRQVYGMALGERDINRHLYEDPGDMIVAVPGWCVRELLMIHHAPRETRPATPL